MSQQLQERILGELLRVPLIDPHTHINPHAAASKTLADVLGYHYYTELVHSAGLPREEIEKPELEPKQKVALLVSRLHELDNTIQYHWLLEMCQAFFGHTDEGITPANWEPLYDRSARIMAQPDWEDEVLRKTGLERVFLTNDFDDPLEGFDTARYTPCLRTDDLVFGLAQQKTRERLSRATGIEAANPAALRKALGYLFEHFTRRGARACAISLPPDFEPCAVEAADVEPVLKSLYSGREVSDEQSRCVGRFVFWTLAELCAEHRLPFDLMIGVNRRVYPGGVHQGQDLFDSRTSLIQYRHLFNAFPRVTFPVSVLAHVTNQELVAWSWIFPNVVTHGHWWYSNIPTYIDIDCRSRLEAVPRSKQIGYYSDMYKLEFALPKFNMYRRILARALATDFVLGRRWTEERAIAFGRQVLRGNVERVFGG